ncbi:photosynthetic reaction center cytochrome c subunit family protein [Fimbriimonas ginsengisoli]|uniref:C-type cytochrome n=1 Tax=Fimbriimonas ginsengisoli Gsoil 348 TaxID=661478 RepID=A0A068NT44_FIMGI|nr:photosynthetic reaction center cytochrome c subunit family protein [Fimbriimonas ginsengisoli]AIE86571.1 hypothetical protein OP10G_3203 [Fimbriimonas ginsengisoli Gsoil 348]
MRRTYVFLGLSCLVFGTAIGAPRQEPLAEQQFKNIVSFKGEKAADVMPAMEFMSGSLKVECDYCHTDDRASDAKEEKKTAREMIAMQRDINAKHFGGRNVITCATCHGGKTHPTPVPPIEGLEVRARRSDSVAPAQVLQAYGKAVGGDAAKVRAGVRLEGTTTLKGEKTRVEAIYAGDKYRFVNHEKKGDKPEGFNGSMAWFSMPYGIQPVPLQYAVQFVNQRQVFTGPDSLPKLQNLTGGTAKLDGRDNLVVTGFQPDKTRISLYFDKQTGLLGRAAFYYPTILGTIVRINDYSDYRKVEGVPFPMTVKIHSPEGEIVQQFRSARLDPKVSATTFDPPKK